jgi:hypothetical protein
MTIQLISRDWSLRGPEERRLRSMMLGSGGGYERRRIIKAKQLSRLGRIFADGRRIDEALRLAARDAIRKHKQHNVPVVVWRDGATAWVPTRELGMKVYRKTTRGRRLSKRGR